MRCASGSWRNGFVLCFLIAIAALPVDKAFSQAPRLQKLQILTAQAADAYRSGRIDIALALAIKVVEGSRVRFGEVHLRYAQALNNLALLQDLNGSLVEAVKNYKTAIHIVHELRGNHVGQLAELKNNLAAVILQQCQIKEAQALYAEALRLTEALHGARHSETELVRANVDKLKRYMTGQHGSRPETRQADTSSGNVGVESMLRRCIS